MECVDWNLLDLVALVNLFGSHSVMECVDWNPPRPAIEEVDRVALCNGVRGLKLISSIISSATSPVALCNGVRGLK